MKGFLVAVGLWAAFLSGYALARWDLQQDIFYGREVVVAGEKFFCGVIDK
jgi:hypothetical protein